MNQQHCNIYPLLKAVHGCWHNALFIKCEHTATTYNPAHSLFPTYARKIVHNGLLSYCRQMCFRQRRFTYLTVGLHAAPSDTEARQT
ncbi:hypothetical protein IMSAGC019_03922 [Lachnospiraceae bacterium]|nr:hypothetical protein IMSAGC019_03922 [Lachnospiraceae bacterium]